MTILKNTLVILFNIALLISGLIYIIEYVGIQKFIIYMCVFYCIFSILKKWD